MNSENHEKIPGTVKKSNNIERITRDWFLLAMMIVCISLDCSASTRIPQTLQEEVNGSNLIFVGKVVKVEPVEIGGIGMGRVQYSIEQLLLDQNSRVPRGNSIIKLHLFTSVIGSPKPEVGEIALWMLNVSRGYKGRDILVGGGEKYSFEQIDSSESFKVFTLGSAIGVSSCNELTFPKNVQRAIDLESFIKCVKERIQQRK